MSQRRTAAVTAAAVVRPATAADLPRVVAGADRIFRQPLRPGQGSMGRDYPLLFDAGNAGNLWLAEDERGEVIAHAGFVALQAAITGARAKVACFGAVYTVPEHQGQGLASRVFAAAAGHARAGGADLALVSGERGLYQRAGFVPYPPCRRYRVGADATAGGLPAADAVPFRPSALEEVISLYAAEPVHFERSSEEWAQLLQTGILFFYRSQLYLIERAGRPVAYAGVALLKRSDEPEGTIARVLELAGDRRALAAAAPSLRRQLGATSLEVVVPPHDHSLEALAPALGWTGDEIRFPFASARWNPAHAQLPLPFYGFNYV
jgi:GNAT superfamily N-acetyltransferase